MREWPDTVRIVVRERRPVAWIDGPAGKSVIDGAGRVLEVVETPPPGLPQLLGTKLVPPVGGTIAPVDGARVAGALTGFAAGGTASVEVTDHGVLLHLVSGPEIRMGPATQIAVKVRAGGGRARCLARRRGALRRRQRPHQPGGGLRGPRRLAPSRCPCGRWGS